MSGAAASFAHGDAAEDLAAPGGADAFAMMDGLVCGIADADGFHASEVRVARQGPPSPGSTTLPAFECSRRAHDRRLVQGDLNLRNKPSISLGRPPSAKHKKPSNPSRLLGFLIDLVAGTGFEPVTFRL